MMYIKPKFIFILVLSLMFGVSTIEADTNIPSTPVITSPVTDSIVASPVTFSGTCEVGTFVTVSGLTGSDASTTCAAGGVFSINIASTTASGTQTVSMTATYSGWATTTPALNYGTGGYNFVANGYLYSAGGYDENHYASTEETYVNRAQIHNDGTLGSWQTVGQYDGFGQFFGSGVYLNGKLFLIGGVDPFYFERLSRVKSATLSTTTNTVGSWITESNGLPAPQWNFGLATNGNFIYTVGGMDNNFTPTNVVYYTQVDTDGTMHAWQSATPLPDNRVAANVFVLNNKLYVIGGKTQQYSGDTNTVYYATINGDGSLGTWQQDSNLPFLYGITSAASTVHIIDGYIYVLGTGSDGKGVKYAQIQGDGSFGEWQSGPSLLVRVMSQTAQYSGNIYALGTFPPSDTTVQHIHVNQLKIAGNTSGTTTVSFAIDNTVPTLVSASINSTNVIRLTYSKNLDSHTPQTTDFSVSVDGVHATTTSVQVSGNKVYISISQTVNASQNVTLSYIAPGSNALQDNLGHQAVNLNNVVVLVDKVAPIISEVSPIPTGIDTTPDYTFTTSEAGAISYGGSCSSAATDAILGSNTITLNALSLGTHSDCTITVTDSVGNVSNTLSITPFTIIAPPPIAGPSYGGGSSSSEQGWWNTQTTSTSAKPAHTSTPYTRIVTTGMIGNDIKQLQIFLNTHGFSISKNGLGSLGKETTKFGGATKAALIKFQKAHNIKPAIGIFGPVTRKVVEGMK